MVGRQRRRTRREHRRRERDGLGLARGEGDGDETSADSGAAAVDETGAPETECVLDPDVDGDGYDAVACGGTDCNDRDAAVHPDAVETCNAVDEDCDESTLGLLDDDRDGEVSRACCNTQADGTVWCGGDCDDSLSGTGLGSWAHCGRCGDVCATAEACEEGECVAARRVFVRAATTSGDLGGYDGADALCQASADAAGLGGVFRAFLGGPTPGLDRLEHPDVPFVRLDGVRVADDWEDLVDGGLHNPLDRDETGAVVGGLVWTGMPQVIGSLLSNDHCNGWTYAGTGCGGVSPCGAAGEAASVAEEWDGYFIYQCDAQHRLYCLEQA
ncbi:MAG: MopE-related protein [Myxococcota bacterium]